MATRNPQYRESGPLRFRDQRVPAGGSDGRHERGELSGEDGG